jgi:ATP-dependent DNA ligase
LTDQPPQGPDWIHEIKHDGYRCQVLLERGQARVFTRNGYDWSDRYPSIVRTAANLRCQSAIIDGVVQDGTQTRSASEASGGKQDAPSRHGKRGETEANVVAEDRDNAIYHTACNT